MTEAHLIRQAQRGNRDALAQLYEKYVDAMYRFHFWQTNGNREAAEDLTQDTFLEAARSLPTFAQRSSFKNWLYTIAKRQLSKWIRRKYDAPELPLFEAITDTPSWIDPDEQQRKIHQLEALLLHLSPRAATVLRCRYLQNLSLEETARQLGISISNVKVIQHRALKKLQVLLERNQLDTIILTYAYAKTSL